MLLFIGGAARTGKGILVRRLLHDMQFSYLSLDVLKMGLTRGVPEFVIDPDAGALPVAERLWPLVREMSHNLVAEQIDYAIEGELLPRHVAALRQTYPAQVQACFLGYTQIAPADKLCAIRANSGYPNDWPQECDDAKLLGIIRSNIAFSHYLIAECAAYNVPYFDTSEHFGPILDAVVAYVRAAR
jgi:hypothetical protein